MSQKLTFVLVDRLEETYEHERDEVWGERCSLSDEDRAQFLALVLQPIEPSLTDDHLQKKKANELFTGALEGFDDHPIELWDLVDEDEVPLYRLWLFHGNRGLLLETSTEVDEETEAETTTVKVIANVDSCIMHGDYENIDYHELEDLRPVLHAAQKASKRVIATSELAWIEF